MARNVWTAVEVEQLSPADQHALFEDTIVHDLDDVPAEFLDRVRARIRQHISETEQTDR